MMVTVCVFKRSRENIIKVNEKNIGEQQQFD